MGERNRGIGRPEDTTMADAASREQRIERAIRKLWWYRALLAVVLLAWVPGGNKTAEVLAAAGFAHDATTIISFMLWISVVLYLISRSWFDKCPACGGAFQFKRKGKPIPPFSSCSRCGFAFRH
jgi:hypothetical protein